jgi:CheY-like chemotaxis protein/HPt (histidine-containing phosphotransfer) domain-containing protein
VHSDPGRGSEFHFTLDFGLVPQAIAVVGHDWRGFRARVVDDSASARDALGRPSLAPAAPEAGGLEPIEQLGGCRILLVEDNELNQIVASDLLRGVAGALVQIANNGDEALARLAQQPFDLVLMDVQMPGMDGHEATRRLRANPALAALPVVAMTAHAMARDRELCLAAGMNDFVSKPFEPRELFKVLARWLPLNRAAQGPAAGPMDGVSTAEAPAVSFALGLHRCMGRRDLYTRVLRQFLESHGGDSQRLHQALERGEIATAAMIAHTLVSAAGAIGAESLAASVRALQHACAHAPDPSLPALRAAFTHEHARVLASLAAHLQAPDDRPVP